MKSIITALILFSTSAFAGTVSLPGQSINTKQLSDELVASGYTCTILQSNRVVVDGMVVLDAATKKPVTVDPYITINCKQDIDVPVVTGILNAHIPIAEPVRKTSEERRKEEIRAEATVLLRELGLID